MRGWLLLLVASLALSGCASSPTAAGEDVRFTTAARPVNARPDYPCLGFSGDGDLAGIGLEPPAIGPTSFSAFANDAELGVPADAAAIVLDLWWEGGAATAIRSQATGPGGAGATSPAYASASEEEPVRLRIDAPTPGAWRWEAIADPAAAGVVLHFNYGLYFESPESLAFTCNGGHVGKGG